MKFGFDMLAKHFQRRNCLKIMVMYMYIALGQGKTATWDQSLFKKHKYFVNMGICCKYYPLDDFVTFFPFKRICVQI